MTEVAVAALAFLGVSLLSLAVYLYALWSLWRDPATLNQAAYRGLLRTAVSRVFVACLYITLAVLVLTNTINAWSSLIVFTAAQLCWQANSVMDIRLRRVLSKKSAHPTDELN
jgi:hypothetical protein